ncbi:hypothetical protein VNO78_09947 [Psophocarpus tetragonolobus]|uniref:Uncharacterized protein n=1 Tax=Psophocarpus tetragonolobus TaxID=3891 RepID=A0AAN9SL45_PSOTE
MHGDGQEKGMSNGEMECVVKVVCYGKVREECDGVWKEERVDHVRDKERFQNFTCLKKENTKRKFQKERAQDLLTTLFTFVALFLLFPC